MGVFFNRTPDKNDRQELFSRFEKAHLLMSSSEELSSDRAQLYDLFSYNTWNDNDMEFETKRDAIQALENYHAFQQGRPAKEVSIIPLPDGKYGGWNADQDVIKLNENLVKNSSLYSDSYATAMPDANMQIFDTIAHEGYHAYQSYALEHPNIHDDKKQLREWALNEGKYYKEGNKYLIQPQERDAWDYGHQATVSAFRGIEARNGAEPGKQEYENTAALNSYENALQRELAWDPEVLNNMEYEMEQGCQAKGIFYDYAPKTEAHSQPNQNEDLIDSSGQEQQTDSESESENENVSMEQLADSGQQAAREEANSLSGEEQQTDSENENESENVSMDQLTDMGQQTAGEEANSLSGQEQQTDSESENVSMDQLTDMGQQTAGEEANSLSGQEQQTDSESESASMEQLADSGQQTAGEEANSLSGQEQQTNSENENVSMDQLTDMGQQTAGEEANSLSGQEQQTDSESESEENDQKYSY